MMLKKPVKVLLIEDNPGDARLIKEMLKEARSVRFEPHLADRLSAGLKRLEDETFDTILLDLTLPDCAGLDTLARVYAKSPTVPIVVLTGLSDATLGFTAVSRGAQDYLVKGRFDDDLLERAACHAIERKRSQQELKNSADRLQKAMDGIIQAIALINEYRDPYTAGHQKRVAKLACAIAREMKMSDWEIEGIRVAGLLHDLGKINVPVEILAKPRPLSELEEKMVRTHPEVGYEILKTIEFPWAIARAVLQHHERLDGSGYPGGLRGGDILPEARILAVADAVEVMTTNRPYRAARRLEDALAELARGKGALYHPDVVDACLTVFQDRRLDG
jgi:putative two-component system response regulator